MNDYAIDIQNLTKTYGKHRGVKHLSLQVPKGDIFGFLGPNGAGKSTTIRCMLGMLRFQEGTIRILGRCAGEPNRRIPRKHDGESNRRIPGRHDGELNREILHHVGYVPSETMFYQNMRVGEVIRFAARARHMDCTEEANRLCAVLELDQGKRISELSLGNRKKVGIVCAMQHKPELLILDEPTSGLDPLMQEAFFGLLLEYNEQGTTCFLSSHVLPEVKRYCKHVAMIGDGELIRTDSVSHLLQSAVRQVKVWKNGGKQEFSYSGDMRALLKELDEAQVDDVLIEEPSLEQLFMHYYRSGGEER